MKKLCLITLCVFTLCLILTCGCGSDKSGSLSQRSELTRQVQEIETKDEDLENEDCPDCGDDRPAPRKSCKRNRKMPPRRKAHPNNTDKKSPD